MTLSERDEGRVLALKNEWPKCWYRNAVNERQHRRKTKRRVTVESESLRLLRVFDTLSQWDELPEVCVDGTNGCGKTTLVNLLASDGNRRPVKINNIRPKVTKGSRYNLDVIRGLEYMFTPVSVSGDGLCWDRHCLSNLIFYYVHMLMYVYRDSVVPESSQGPYSVFNSLAANTQLHETLTLLESVSRLNKGTVVPVLYITCSDVSIVSTSLRNRASTLSDVYNSKELNYNRAQHHAYMYFAEVTDRPIIDLAPLLKSGYTLDEIQSILKNRLSYTGKLPDVEEPLQFKKAQIEAADRFLTLWDELQNDTLIYEASTK